MAVVRAVRVGWRRGSCVGGCEVGFGLDGGVGERLELMGH